MITDARKRLFTIIGIFSGLVLALVFFILVIRDGGSTAQQEQVPEESTNRNARPPVETSENTRESSSSPVANQEDPEDVYLKQLARIFVERFESRSNQNNNTHIADVLPIVTARMARFVQSQEAAFDMNYSGITTKVVASSITQKSSTAATVTVDVQRIVETSGTRETEYRHGRVALQKDSGEWKIDGFYWE